MAFYFTKVSLHIYQKLYIFVQEQTMLKNNKNTIYFIYLICALLIAWFFLYFSIGKNFAYEFANNDFQLIFPKIIVFLAAVSFYILVILQINLDKKWHVTNIIKFIGAIILGSLPFIIYGFFTLQNCPFWLQQKETKEILYQSKVNKNDLIFVQKTTCLDSESYHYDTIKSVKYFDFLKNDYQIKQSQIDLKHWNKINTGH